MTELTEREKTLAAIALRQSLAINSAIMTNFNLKFTDPEVWFVFECRVCGCETHTNNPMASHAHMEACMVKMLEDARNAFDQWIKELNDE